MTAVEASVNGLATPNGVANPRVATPTATLTPTRDPDAMSTISSFTDVEARCGGCKNIIDQENGGIVVAFGNSWWHVDCFKCAKCGEKVSADTNLLLLSDGSPVCGNCSYQCFVCKQAITEEAIMTGDESYHAHCFTCRTCKRRIEELVFAKTSQGIYCMTCHNDRVARSRRHAEAKKQRAARKEREKEEAEARRREREANGMRLSNTSTSLNLLTTVASNASGASSVVSPSSSRYHDATSPRSIGSAYADSARRDRSVDRSPIPPSQREQSPVPPSNRRNNSVPASPMAGTDPAPMVRSGSADAWCPQDAVPPPRTAASGANTAAPLASPNAKSPLNAANPLTGSQSVGNILTPTGSRSPTTVRSPSTNVLGASSPAGLGVPTSKAEKRRSINPGMAFNMDANNATFAAEPRAPSPLRSSFSTGPTASQESTETVKGSVAMPTPSPAPAPADGTTSETPTTVPKVASPSASPTIGTGPPAPATPAVEKSPDLSDKWSPKSETNTSASGKAPTTAETTPRSAEPSHDGHTKSPGKKGASMANGDQPPMPRIDGVSLPTMSFSLSDPDFASILNGGTDKNPDDKPFPSRLRTDSEAESSIVSDSDDVGTSSPTGMARSPNMDLVASSANGELTPSTSRTLLSPNDQPAGGATSTVRRRGSKESMLSVRMDPDSSFQMLAELVVGLQPGDDGKVSVDHALLTEAIREHQSLKESADTLRFKYSGAKRSSQQYSDGLTIAGEEYDKEAKRRRELEAEIARLRSQLHSQGARLSIISSDERRQENMRRLSHDLASNLTGLERDISRLRAQRDISLAEVEELQAQKGDVGTEEGPSKLQRSLTHRLEKIKEEYRDELAPLSAKREALAREITELENTKEQYIEEAASLQAKNDEMSELNAQLVRQNETLQGRAPGAVNALKSPRGHPSGSPSMSSLTAALHDVPEETKETARVVKVSKPEAIEVPARRFKWIGKAAKAVDADKLMAGATGGNRKVRPSTEVGTREHHFQQHSTMRLGRCELCQDKMWGLQEVRCASCGMVCHQKCADKLPKSCPGKGANDDGPLPPSMFGRELSEQATSDGAPVPVIVTKCISAVEANGMEYEGIYRKTGGSSQSKQITQLFERGKYDAFDLSNLENFNDISSITSVLKTYFRQLPDPLLTHALHESFVAAANIRDPSNKHQALCALLKELPRPHYDTLKTLMLHLNRITAQSDVNLMTSQNLGVVFGPTLLRSADPNREFGDMAGKALSVQWMVENAPTVFTDE